MQLAQYPEQEESARLYRLIAETIPHIVWTARADGSLDFFNRRCYDYTGLAHGGTLRVVSSSGGTRVTAEIPLIKLS